MTAALIYQAAALVLSYPDERVLAAVPTIRAALAGTKEERLRGSRESHN